MVNRVLNLKGGWKGKKRPPFSEEWKRKIGIGNKGKVVSKESRDKISRNNSKYWLGKKRSNETIEKIRNANIGRIEERSSNWKGEITPINKIIRGSMEYKLWRESVCKRDNYTCQECEDKKNTLEAHHIRPFAFGLLKELNHQRK